jgi:hypothetical protein
VITSEVFVDTTRKEEMIASIKERLTSETDAADSVGRLVWLLNHLEEYLERWIDFSRIDTIQLADILNSDLHTVLLIGIAIFDDEINADPKAPVRQEWSEFVHLIQSVNPKSNKNIGQELSLALRRVQTQISEGGKGGTE